ncbi:MAG: hypothetical protein GQ574_18305 [Crocinitomix sp.]|nr:hypothetical protein [Crocinitomix sp.]
MPKKIALSLLFIFCLATLSFAQKQKTVLKAPKAWITEIIPFPLDFAPSIPYMGIEDLRFAPNWSDSTNDNFWTYMFVWYVLKDKPVSTDILTKYFNAYYNGLMRIESRNKSEYKDKPLKKVNSSFTKTASGFNGTMEVFDGFFTKKYMTLNIKITETFCEEMNRQIIRCDVSRQAFDHAVWENFKEVKVKVKCK